MEEERRGRRVTSCGTWFLPQKVDVELRRPDERLHHQREGEKKVVRVLSVQVYVGPAVVSDWLTV